MVRIRRVWPVAWPLAIVACTFDVREAVAEGTTGGTSTGASPGAASESESAPDPSATTQVDGGGGQESGATTSGTSDATGTDAGEVESSTGAAVDGSDEAGSSTGSAVACTSALMVTGDTNLEANDDAPFYERLVQMGFTVTAVASPASSAGDVGDNCLVLLSAIGSSTDIADKFRDVPVPVIVWESSIYDDMRFVGADATSYGVAEPEDDIEISDAAHAMAGGLSGVVSIWSGGGRVGWGVPLASAEVVATVPGDPTHAAIMGYDTGAVMADGFVAPARRVAFPGGTTVATMTPARVDLFEAAVTWAVSEGG